MVQNNRITLYDLQLASGCTISPVVWRTKYADFNALAVSPWAASVAKRPLLTEDDPLSDWLDRGFDLYDGLGCHPRMQSLSGLQLREGGPAPSAKDGGRAAPAPLHRGAGTVAAPQLITKN